MNEYPLRINPKDDGTYYIIQAAIYLTSPPGYPEEDHYTTGSISYYDIVNGERKFDHSITSYKNDSWYSNDPDDLYQQKIAYQKIKNEGLILEMTSFADYDPNNVTIYKPEDITETDPEPSNPTKPDTPTTQTEVTVYRLYNSGSGEHLYTTDKNEYDSLPASGWQQEGKSWGAPTNGEPVYRLYCSETGNHLYTKDANEKSSLLAIGIWTTDNDGKPLLYSGGSVPIYRLYNEGLKMHLLTKDANEYSVLGNSGWKQENVSLYALN